MAVGRYKLWPRAHYRALSPPGNLQLPQQLLLLLGLDLALHHNQRVLNVIVTSPQSQLVSLGRAGHGVVLLAPAARARWLKCIVKLGKVSIKKYSGFYH